MFTSLKNRTQRTSAPKMIRPVMTQGSKYGKVRNKATAKGVRESILRVSKCATLRKVTMKFIAA